MSMAGRSCAPQKTRGEHPRNVNPMMAEQRLADQARLGLGKVGC